MPNLPKLYLFLRAKKFYYVQYRDEGRLRWKSTGCTTKAEALKAVTRLQELFKPKLEVKPLAAFCSEFLEHARTVLRPSTVMINEGAFRHLQGQRCLRAIQFAFAIPIATG